MTDKKLFWYKQEANLFDSEEMEDLFAIKRRDQHKIFFVLCVIQSYITTQVDETCIDECSEFEMRFSLLIRRCHLNIATVIDMIGVCSIFGVETVQVCDKSIIVRYPKFMKLLNLPTQNKNKNYKRNTTTYRIEDNTDSAVQKTASSSSGERGENKDPKPNSSNLSKEQGSLKFIRGNDKCYWDKVKDFNIVEDLNLYFPDMREENIKFEVNKITERLINMSDFEFDKQSPYGYMYLYNCLSRSKQRQQNNSERSI